MSHSDHGAVGTKCYRMAPTCSDLDDIRPVADIALPELVISHSDHGPVGLEPRRVPQACGDLNNVRPVAHITLTVGVLSHGDYRTAGLEPHRVPITHCELDDVRPTLDIALPIVVIPHSEHGAIVHEPHRVHDICRDVGDLRPAGDCTLPVEGPPGGDYRTVGLKSHRMPATCGDLDDIRPLADITLPIVVQSQGNHSAVGPKPYGVVKPGADSQLAWTCAELGFLDEAVESGLRAREACTQMEADYFVFCITLFGLGQAYWYRGESRKALEVGKDLLEFGKRNSHIRSMVCGHYTMGHRYFIAGDFPSAIKCYKEAGEISADPYYSQIPRTALGYAYVSNRDFDKAEEILKEVQVFSQQYGVEIIGTAAHGLLGIVLSGTGHLREGVARLEDVRRTFREKNRRCLYAAAENTLGMVYFEIAHGGGKKDFRTIARNLGFLVKALPVASKKAEGYFKRAAEAAVEIGAKSILAQAYFNLGRLFMARNKKREARRYLDDAVTLFEQCEAEIFLKQAKDALETLG